MFRAENYMDELGVKFEKLRKQKVTENEVKTYIEFLLPIEDKVSKVQEKNVDFISDFATYTEPIRRTANNIGIY